jgi:hypothetical protein
MSTIRLEAIRPHSFVRAAVAVAYLTCAWLVPATFVPVVSPDQRFAAVFGAALLVVSTLGYLVWTAPGGLRIDALVRYLVAAGLAWAGVITATIAAWAIAINGSLCGTKPFLRFATATPSLAVYLGLGIWLLRTSSSRTLWAWPIAVAAATAAFVLFQVVPGGHSYCDASIFG